MIDNDSSEQEAKRKEIEEFSFEIRTFRQFMKDVNGLNEIMLLMFSHRFLGRNDNGTNECHYHDIMRGLNILLLDCATNLNK